MNKWYFNLIICLILSGCIGKESETARTGTHSTKSIHQIKYASCFTMENNGDQMVITVTNPWQNAQQTIYTYILSDSVESSGLINNRKSIIKIPVKRVVCLSTTHIGFIDYLDKTESITGISGKDYVVNSRLQKRIKQGLVLDVGYDENINYELLLKLEPDIVFAYGVTGSVTKIINKLNEMHIPVVMVAEYLEQHPLAKMEWIKFFAAFYGLAPEVSARFDSVAYEYNHLSELVHDFTDKPMVILGLPWRGTWYVSGGQSYIAQLIEDAGGNYVWKSLDYKDSKPIELEKVYENALRADFWLNTGDARSKADIISTDERFKNLPAFQRNMIFNNNRLLSPAGGNAYFESGVVEPHIILKDIMSILHPQLLPSHELKYYQKLP